MPLVPSGGRWTKQPPGQAFIQPEFQRDLIFAARGAAGGVLDFHKYVYTGNTGTGSSDPPAIVNAAADSADGKAWNTTSAYISGRNVTGADRPLVETEAARDWTFQFVVHNVQQTGTNPGFWRTEVAQAGPTFVIANGSNRRPWVRINGTDVIKAASGAQWALGQKLNFLVRVKSSSRVEVWWDGRVQHSATHSVATTSLITTGAIYAFGSQNLTERIQGAVTAIRFWNRYLPDDQMALLGADEWAFYKPRRIWVPVSAGGLTAVTSDAPLAWTVRNAVQLDQALAYALRSGIQADRSLSWVLRAGVQKDQSLAWTVRNTVQRDQALAYTLRNAVQADRSLSWALRNAAQGDAPLAWIVRSGVLRDQALAYGVRGTAQKDQSLAWSVVAKVQKDQSLAWSVASTGTVISDQPLSWLVRSTTQRDQALAYPVRAAVQSDKALAWSVRSTAQSDKALAWSVRNAVQRDQALAYSILAAAQRDQSLSWLVRGRVQRDHPLAWIMRSGIQQDQPLAFPIRGATQQDQPLSWSVLTSAVADASLSWIMRSGVSRDQGIAYQVYSIAQRDQALAWTVASSVALPAVICITVEPFYGFQQSEIVDVWRLNGSIEPVLRGCDS